MPGRAGEAVGRGVARVGHRDHQVGFDRRLAPEDLAHPPAHLLQHPALEPGVGTGEVDVLEDAVGGALGAARPGGLEPVLGERDQLAGLTSRSSSAPMMSKAQLSEATQ